MSCWSQSIGHVKALKSLANQEKAGGMNLHAQYNEDPEVVIVKMGVAYYPEHWEQDAK
ncbi:hypothetical protein P4637_13610 [Halalkalibacterium halodurans]|uniref:hypothetical protein n=1 Tax=Halalkalibacterium halodurans TaxID=86665 RepID=UPI002E245EAE|nr:hypothetical protein [Halalkalibacterium halodurans]MED4085846.1 hypothetical protein [Halalkalibacterium halodurans]MED4105191.1 hypothetical protein [Halalkalibacterium halodurans]MED4111089.1 hypothetical protein [Halalkalibacterium halodurans]MED4125587.1 hypothetical protein [Halalkalibacterium halodurans]